MLLCAVFLAGTHLVQEGGADVRPVESNRAVSRTTQTAPSEDDIGVARDPAEQRQRSGETAETRQDLTAKVSVKKRLDSRED